MFQVLRPVSCVCRLKVWPYYYREVLSEGPSYDGLLNELSSGTSHNQHEATEVGGMLWWMLPSSDVFVCRQARLGGELLVGEWLIFAMITSRKLSRIQWGGRWFCVMYWVSWDYLFSGCYLTRLRLSNVSSTNRLIHGAPGGPRSITALIKWENIPISIH